MPPHLNDLPNLKGSVFIVTYGRSGSTLLQSMLQTIPGIHLSGENYGALLKLREVSSCAVRMKQIWGQKVNHPGFTGG
jgi:hypothetical protein